MYLDGICKDGFGKVRFSPSTQSLRHSQGIPELTAGEWLERAG